MKIRRLNESVDVDYIEECFIDFIDEGSEYESDYSELNMFNGVSPMETLFQIFIDLPELNFDEYQGNFDNHIKNINSKLNTYSNILLKVESCVERIKIKYENIFAYVIPEDEECISIEIRRKKL